MFGSESILYVMKCQLVKDLIKEVELNSAELNRLAYTQIL